MRRLRLAMELLFQRQISADEDATLAMDRIGREIKGSIYSLVAVFFLVALTSYVAIDKASLASGRFDQIHNLGGLVGAMIGEWVLGTVGSPGYAVIFLFGWISYGAFRSIPLQNYLFKIIGIALGTVLASITCHLVLADQVSEGSLLQGGSLGLAAGGWLKHYFNVTGSLLLVGGGFLVTFILTFGVSLSNTARSLFEPKDAVDEEEPERIERPAPRLRAVPAPTSAAAPTEPEAKKPRARRKPSIKKLADPNASGEDGVAQELEADEETAAASAPRSSEHEEIIPYSGNYQMPTTRLLKAAEGNPKKLSKGELKENAQRLTEQLLSFQITGEVTDITQGPVLITYEFKPSSGIKLSKIAALQDDLGISLGTSELRIVAPIPGKTVVGIEVPRPKTETISLKEVLGEDAFFDKKNRLPVALGKTTDGRPVFGDLAAMPHLLVAGGTGSGKSVFINNLIMSFMFRLSPNQLRMILVDPKMLELSVFDGIPHLLTNVITDHKIAFNALNWAVWEMDRRYALMAKTNSKNIDSYNEKMKTATSKLPFIVIVVDELADLMMSGGQVVELAITRLAQKARAAGIHLVIATQRPSTDVVTGLIKANMPSRIAFRVPSGVDSRTVLDTSGAEALIGRGDCLMVSPGNPLRRMHGTFVTEDELVRVVKFVKDGKNHAKNYMDFSGAPAGSEE